ncbi:MAG: hypothetical protein LKE46_14325 [Clostridium sp.]|nr:hypothetical protein [Clostridium sp.]MCI1717297.1 hypothetical protein [Clostridium sp.]MCI1801637.1 hypothetical protein [Clostridium sp.]MCI1815483.1 hypothetical protein [Clostridium sp.]MCI1872386.1 hypothetical protein [Clostridium sp.]
MNNISSQTLGVYVKKYKLFRIRGLAMGKSSGVPRHLTGDQESELVKIITTSTPDEEGFTARKN